jgi:hypothetical protein
VEEAETEAYEDHDFIHLEEEVVPAVLSTCPVFAWEPEISPEMRIWAAVLVGAISDLGKKAHRDSALEWISDDRHEMGTFIWICELFRLAPDRMHIPEQTGHRFRCKVGHPFRCKLVQAFRCNVGH